MSPTSPIVVLDSGLGGLTVVRALRARMPGEEILYFGDTARLPYGSKSAATVTTFVRQIINYLCPFHPKHVVIACNTATALALPAVQAMFPTLSITGVVDPGAKAAVIAAGSKRFPVIGVLATEATVRSKAYERAILRRRNHAKLLLRPAPLLVPIIEEGRDGRDALTRLAVKQYLAPLLRHKMDVLVLGCTHYPILRDLIANCAGPSVCVIDSAEQCADDVARRLWAAGLARANGAGSASSAVLAGAATATRFALAVKGPPRIARTPAMSVPSSAGGLRCFVTDDAPRFGELAARFLGAPIDPPTWVPPEDLYGGDAAAIAPVPLRRPA